MSIAKLLESKETLFRLYVDRYQEVPLDLRGALDRAQARVLNVTNVPSNGALGPVKSLPLPSDGAIRWGPKIPGGGEDPEAGLADGQVG
ncbi:MAG TPA: hypothetical protein VF205_10955 [Nitrospiraceae bacterium]